MIETTTNELTAREATDRRISVDWENNAEFFWDSARTQIEKKEFDALSGPALAAARVLIGPNGYDTIYVTADVAKDLYAWFETVPGWDSERGARVLDWKSRHCRVCAVSCARTRVMWTHAWR